MTPTQFDELQDFLAARSTKITKQLARQPLPKIVRGREKLHTEWYGKSFILTKNSGVQGVATIQDGYLENGFAHYIAMVDQGNPKYKPVCFYLRQRDVGAECEPVARPTKTKKTAGTTKKATTKATTKAATTKAAAK